MIRRPPRSTPFPYTTPSRSVLRFALVGGSHTPPGRRQLAQCLLLLAQLALPRLQVLAGRQGLQLLRETLALPLGLRAPLADRKSTRLNSSHANISYAVFCLK